MKDPIEIPETSPHPNPLPKGEGKSRFSPLPKGEGKERGAKRRAPTRARPTKTLARELKGIYADADGRVPDLTKLTITRERRFRKALVLTAIFFAALAAAAWAGFFIFKPFGRFQGGGLEFSYDAPAPFHAGGEATLVVRYQNRERVPLGQVNILVSPPAGFEIVDASPPATDSRRWSIGNVAATASGEITLRGRVLGALGSELAVQTTATYVPGNFNSEFQSVGTFRTTVDGGVITLASEAPESVPAGEPFDWKISYAHEGTFPLDGSELRATLPEHFQPATSNPEGEEHRTWKLGTFATGTAGSVTIHGSFSGEASGSRDFAVTLGQQGTGGFVPFAIAASTIKVLGGELKTTALINGSTAPQPLNFGDTLRISLVYKNQGTESLKDVELALTLDPSPAQGDTSILDWSTLEDAANGRRDRNTIRWTRRNIAVLKSLPPNGEGTIDVVVGLRDKPFTLDTRVYTLAASVESKIGSVGSKRIDRTVRSTPLVFPINSDASLASRARYYNDDEIPVGTGPLPPKVGETTTFRIFWEVTNTLHELQNISVAAVLLDGVNWTNKANVSAGTVQYDPATRRVVWTLNRLPDTVPSVTADFEVSAIPSESQAGAVLPLLGQTSLDADDSVAQSHLTRSAPAADSSLEGDPIAEGRGMVVR